MQPENPHQIQPRKQFVIDQPLDMIPLQTVDQRLYIDLKLRAVSIGTRRQAVTDFASE